MNPMLRGMGGPFNMLNVINQVRQLQNNPQGITDFLRKSGRLNDQQMKAIEGMHGNVSQIGQFLMGGAPQNMYGQIQNDVMNVQNRM